MHMMGMANKYSFDMTKKELDEQRRLRGELSTKEMAKRKVENEEKAKAAAAQPKGRWRCSTAGAGCGRARTRAGGSGASSSPPRPAPCWRRRSEGATGPAKETRRGVADPSLAFDGEGAPCQTVKSCLIPLPAVSMTIHEGPFQAIMSAMSTCIVGW